MEPTYIEATEVEKQDRNIPCNTGRNNFSALVPDWNAYDSNDHTGHKKCTTQNAIQANIIRISSPMKVCRQKRPMRHFEEIEELHQQRLGRASNILISPLVRNKSNCWQCHQGDWKAMLAKKQANYNQVLG